MTAIEINTLNAALSENGLTPGSLDITQKGPAKKKFTELSGADHHYFFDAIKRISQSWLNFGYPVLWDCWESRSLQIL